MSETPTKTNKTSPSKLSVRQLNAAQLLALGRKVNDVAATLNINRHQIWEWQKNYFFVAAIHSARAELWGNAKTRLRGLLDKSVKNLEQAVAEGDVRTSIEVLKILGLYGQVGKPNEPLTAEGVMLQEAKQFAKELLMEPTDDPVADTIFIRDMQPKLVFERYHELKQQLENITGDDDNDVDTTTTA